MSLTPCLRYSSHAALGFPAAAHRAICRQPGNPAHGVCSQAARLPDSPLHTLQWGLCSCIEPQAAAYPSPAIHPTPNQTLQLVCGLHRHVEAALLITPPLSTAPPAPWPATCDGSASRHAPFVPLAYPAQCASGPIHDCVNQQAPTRPHAIQHPHFTSKQTAPGMCVSAQPGCTAVLTNMLHVQLQDWRPPCMNLQPATPTLHGSHAASCASWHGI